MSNAAISVQDVSKRFRIPQERHYTLKSRMIHLRSASRHHDLFALKNISFDVPTGQFLGIIGANGCGKSTLMKIIAQIYLPTTGSIDIHGAISPFLELGVGFNPELTARENVFVNGTILGLNRRELETLVDEIIGFAEVEEFTNQKLKNFSSGMLVRLAFSVAIRAHAEILLMDEVLAVGDARFQQKCFDIFMQYKREGRTVILVTHDLGAVEKYCDRAILLDHGVLIADGKAATVTGKYRSMIAGSEAMGEQSKKPRASRLDAKLNPPVIIDDVDLIFPSSGDGVLPGQEMTIRVAHHFEQTVSLVAHISFYDAHGVALGSVTSDPFTSALGRNTVEFQCSGIPFRGGEYQLQASFWNPATDEQYTASELLPFRVIDYDTHPGTTFISGKWTGISQ